MQSTVEREFARSRPGLALVLYPLAHLAVEVYNSMLSIMWPLFAVRFGLDSAIIGFLTFIFRGSMTLPQLGFAAVSDRHGSRLLGIGGLLLMAVGMGLVGLAPSVGILAAILALAPLGSAAFHPAGTAHMSRALSRRRGTAVAIFMIGGSIGMSFGPVLGAWLYERRGLSASLWLIPLGLAVALLMFLFIPPDSGGVQRRVAAGHARGPIPVTVFLVMVACVVTSWIENGLTLYLPLLITGRGLPLNAASQVLFAFSAAAAGGIFVGGMLSDRMPRWQIITLAQVLAIPLYAGTLLLGGPWRLLAPAALGFVSALGHPTTVALAQELMPEQASLAAALTMGISWVIGSLGVALTGLLARYTGLETALLVNTGLPVLAVASMFAVQRLARTGRQPNAQAQS